MDHLRSENGDVDGDGGQVGADASEVAIRRRVVIARRLQQRENGPAMKAVCPKNAEHKQFVTVAHVTEDWVVDEEGHFIKINADNDTQVVEHPRVGNTWECYECGAIATVSDE